MESDQEILSKIVTERADKIQSEALDHIRHIQEASEKELSRVVPDLMKQIEDGSVFKLLDVLDIIRNGGVVKTCDYENRYDKTYWSLQIGGNDVFYETHLSHGREELSKGRYRITLIMEKLAEEAEVE